MRRWLGVFGLYALLAIGITWPLATDMAGQFIGHSTGDSYEMGHHIWWFTHALRTGEPLFRQTLLAYPDGIAAVTFASNPLQFFPAWLFALVMPVAAAYNLTVLLTMALNGLSMAYLVTRLGQREGWGDAPEPGAPSWAGVLAGAAFCAFPVFQGHVFGGHAGLLVMWPVPLYIDALYRLNDAGGWRNGLRAALLFLISPWGHTVQTICVLLPVTGWFFLAQVGRRAWRAALRTTLAAGAGAVLLLLFIAPVLAETFADDTYTGDQGYVMFSADLLAPVTPSFLHPVFGQWDVTHRVLGVNLTEGFAYYGALAALLTVFAIIRRAAARGWFILALVAIVLSWGPVLKLFDQPLVLRLDNFESFVTMPWAFLYNLPGVELARAPGRFAFVLAVAAGVLIGYGVGALPRWRPAVRAVVGLLMVGVFAFEYQAAWPFPTVPADIPAPIQALREDAAVRSVLHVPWGNLLAAKEALYLHTGHQRPMTAGQISRRTPVSAVKLSVLEAGLDPYLLDREGIDVVIAHKQYWSPELEARLRQQLGAPRYEDARFALFDVPAAPDAPALSVALPPAYVEQVQRTPTQVETYLYAPAGRYVFEAVTEADRRDLTLTVNDQLLGAFPLDGQRVLSEPFTLDAEGYAVVRLTVGEPPCPTLLTSPVLACRGLDVSGVVVRPAP
jgi:hypothetical protein